MGIASNATIGQFTASYAAALSSLGIGCAPQLLCNNGEIIYCGEPTGPDEPFVRIDGSQSIGARNEYVALTVPKEVIFADPKDRDINLLNPTSPFLSEIDRFDEIVDSTTIDVVAEYMRPAHKGPSVSTLKVRLNTLKLRDVLKALSDTNVADEYREGVKRAAYDFATRANDNLMPGQQYELKAAELFFSAAVLFAGLADEKSMERAVEMFAHSAKYFCKTHENPVAAAAVTEILAWLRKDDPKWKDAYLVQAADRWEEAASALHRQGDIFGATIAVYRGLRAAALSSHHEVMKVLFGISWRINGGRGNTEGQIGDCLRSALMILRLHEDGGVLDEKMVWEEAYGGLYVASTLMKDQGMIDALKPFLDAARERSGHGLKMEIRRAAQEAVADPEIVPPSESDDLYENFSGIVEEAVEHYKGITEAGHKTTPEAAARAIVHKHRNSYIDLAYIRYCKAFESGRIDGSPCSRKDFAMRGREKDRLSSIYQRFREIEALGIRPGMNVENGTIKRINWNGLIVCERSDRGTSVNSPFAIAYEILRNNPTR